MKIPIIKTVLKYIVAILLSSIFVISFFVAIPQTEKIRKDINLNLNLNTSSVWEKKFTIQLSFNLAYLEYKWKDINETKNIIINRVKQVGYDYINLDYRDTEENKGELVVTVRSSKTAEAISSLITQRGEIYIATRKEGVNFEDENNQYTIFDPTNYDQTKFTSEYFRSIYVTELKADTGDMSYFGIFKPYFWSTGEYYKFLADNSGKTVGLYIDGFVNPMSVPANTIDQQTRPILAVSLGQEKEYAKNQGIILNNGKIPLEMELKETKDIDIKDVKPNLLFTSIILIASIIIIACFMYYLYSKETAFNFLFTITLLFSIGLAILKLSSMPIDFEYMLIASVITIIANAITTLSKHKTTILIITIVLMFAAMQISFGSGKDILLYCAVGFKLLFILTIFGNMYLKLFKQTIMK